MFRGSVQYSTFSDAIVTEIPVRIADDPLTAVVRGTGLLLEDDDLLKEVRLPSTNER